MKAEYVDHMGTDLSVVNAARVSFDKESDWEWVEAGVKSDTTGESFQRLSQEDTRLIHYLARGCSESDWKRLIQDIMDCSVLDAEGDDVFYIDQDCGRVEEIVKTLANMATHWTPFTHTAITLRMQAPVPIRTQCFKHKQGFTENEESRRYISGRPKLFVPECFREAAKDKKQGSGGPHDHTVSWEQDYIINCEGMITLYEDMIADGISPEQARFVLPQGVEVQWIWTGNLASYARFFNQRTDAHAQKEIQDLARMVGEIIEPLFPVSWRALTHG